MPGGLQTSVAVAVERLQSLLKDRGIMVFAHIDFSGDARRAGLGCESALPSRRTENPDLRVWQPGF